MRSFGATPRFYVERLRNQIAHARGRRYPEAGDVPPRWISYLEARLNGIEKIASSDDCSSLEAENALLTIASCYNGLQVSERAHIGQVAYYVVSGLQRWFDLVDPNCGYLFTSGGDYELTTLLDDEKLEDPEIREAAIVAGLDKTVYAITMPGGALGSAFHIPLVAHEAGHVLAARLDATLIDRLEKQLRPDDLDEVASVSGGKAILEDWMSEIFADTVCGFITGPAGFFALHEKLSESTGFDSKYPPNRLRVQTLGTYVKARFAKVFEANGVHPEEWEKWSVSIGTPANAEEALAPLASIFLRSLDAISRECAAVVEETIPGLVYSSDTLSSDLEAHLEDFYHAIPPFETNADPPRPTRIASVLNVAWFIAAFRLQDMQIEVQGGEGKLLAKLDDLVSKAIELAELRHTWESAG